VAQPGTTGRTPARRRPRRHRAATRPFPASASIQMEHPQRAGFAVAPPDRSRPVRAGDQRLPQSHQAHHHRISTISISISITLVVAATQCEAAAPSGQYVKGVRAKHGDRTCTATHLGGLAPKDSAPQRRRGENQRVVTYRRPATPRASREGVFCEPVPAGWTRFVHLRRRRRRHPQSPLVVRSLTCRDALNPSVHSAPLRSGCGFSSGLRPRSTLLRYGGWSGAATRIADYMRVRPRIDSAGQASFGATSNAVAASGRLLELLHP